jgi:pimeloyl-ACP methyl ester carboxylesterase
MKRFLFPSTLILTTLVLTTPVIAQSKIQFIPPSAIALDPPQDKEHPAHSAEMVVPSHGEKLTGIFYFAAGAGDHPTVVLLHGFPGYEQNLDLAQAIRRAGWNVLALHYRGSWGVGGDFSLEHSMEDADTMVDFVFSDEAAKKLHIDRKHIAVVGHSMGGYMALSTTAHHPSVLGVLGIGTWDITEAARQTKGLDEKDRLARAVKESLENPEDFVPLRNYSPEKLSHEVLAHADAWDPINFVPKLATRPVLLMTADDGSESASTRLNDALQAAGDKKAQKIYTSTDHGFNDKRIYLQSIVLNWLSGLEDSSK